MAGKDNKLNEKMPEETVKPKRRKKLSTDDVVEEIIKNTNIPVYEKEQFPDEFLNLEQAKVKKKEKISRKKLIQE